MFRLENLRNWKDRSFSLSDENDWLDLLDDFGPALPRFLLDDSCASSIPADDGALEELRQSLVKHPVSSLKPDIGSVWVLFAFKEDLQGLPPPFRQDGLLLPFEWRKGESDHSRLLPEELTSLAELVKGQFGNGAADCTLHPTRHFLDAVDFHIPGATFDSAWGALATGLHLLLSRKKHLTAWPFSSIAYDFTSGTFAAVGELERKFLLAASCGAEEIAVAPVQYKEAKRLLASMQKTRTGNKPLKRLAIFNWRPQGDFRRDVAVLSRCNQGTVRKMLCKFGAIFLFALAVVSLGVYDDNRWTYSYFAELKSNGGRWIGESPLEKEDAGKCKYVYRFSYHGYDAPFAIWRRKRLLRKIECIEKDGTLKPIPGRIDGKRIAVIKYLYDSEYRLLSHNLHDIHDRLIERHLLVDGQPGVMEICQYDEQGFLKMGQRTRISFTDDNIVEYTSDGGCIVSSWSSEVGKGLSPERRFVKFDRNAMQSWNVDGVSETHVSYDAYGRETQRLFYGDKQNRVCDHNGISGWTNIYDNVERSTTRCFLSDDGKPTCGNMGCFAEKRYFDGNDRTVRLECLDADGKLMNNANVGIAGFQNHIDASGFVTNQWYFDSNGRRTSVAGGFPIKSIECLRIADNVIRVISRDGDENECSGGGELRGCDLTYNNDGMVTEVSNFGKQGPVKDEQGVVKYIIEYDKYNRLSRVRYFDEHGHMAKMMRSYDEKSKSVMVVDVRTEWLEVRYPDSGDTVCLYKLHKGLEVFYQRNTVSQDGRILKKEFLDQYGRPVCFPGEEYAEYNAMYNSRGELVECEWKDGNGELVVGKTAGVAWIRRNIVHTRDGIKELFSFGGPMDRMQDSDDWGGRTAAILEYDKSGWLVHKKVIDKNGDVIDEMHFLNDSLGRMTNQVVEVQGRKTPGKDVVARISYVYPEGAIVRAEMYGRDGSVLFRKTNFFPRTPEESMQIPLKQRFNAEFMPRFFVKIPSVGDFLRGDSGLAAQHWSAP